MKFTHMPNGDIIRTVEEEDGLLSCMIHNAIDKWKDKKLNENKQVHFEDIQTVLTKKEIPVAKEKVQVHFKAPDNRIFIVIVIVTLSMLIHPLLFLATLIGSIWWGTKW